MGGYSSKHDYARKHADATFTRPSPASVVAPPTPDEFFVASNFDGADATYYFYGGNDSSNNWKINRYHKTTFIKESANEAGNPSYTEISTAWTNRLTLSFV